ncbi:MAG: TIGR01777 family oxidoreductase [Chloroflexota bacterium]
MKVAIVGGSGLVGRALARSLVDDAHEVLVLSRNPSAKANKVGAPARIAAWSKDDVDGLARSIDGFDSVVCVAGARVAPLRWTRRRKATIAGSRRDAIRVIVDALARLPADRRPKSLVVVSGIDAYPESPPGDDPGPWTEASPMGDEFLARVSKTVEDEATRAEGLGVRVAKLRQGHVLARHAELVWYLALPVRLFFGGRLGSGRQWMSWVHIDDAVALFRRAIEGVDGILNVTSPGAVRQIDFVRAVGRRVHRPIWFPTPAWLLKLVLGEQSVLLLGSRRVAPARAQDELGFTFRYATLDAALDEVFAKTP